jgi:hypothetical protein
MVCLFRQAIEQTRYRKKVNRCCNGNRDHPSECQSPVRQFCEPTQHIPSHNSTLQQPGPQAAAHPPAFPTSSTWLTLKMANKRRKNRLMKKYFWRLGCVEARIRSDARRADLPPALRAGSIDDVAECGFASLIGPNGTNTFQVNPRTGLTAATATMRRTSN